MTFNKVIDLLHTAKKNGIEVTLNENKLQLKVPKDKVVDRLLLEELRNNKEVIIGYLNDSRWRSQKNQLHNSIPVFNRNETNRIPLSFEQESLWFIDRLQGSVQFHVPRVLRLKGKLQFELLEEAVREIVQRHEVLRTVILEEDGVGYQQIKSAEDWKLQYISGDDFPAQEIFIKKCVEELLLESFDLSKDYMLRLTLIELSPREHIMVAVMHHIASDGWSMSVLVRELIELYNSKIEGRSANLPGLPVQYADYAAWQRSYLSGKTLDSKLDFWKGQLNGVEPLALRTDFVRPAAQSIKGAVVNRKLSKELSQSLLSISREQGATLFMTLVTGFKVLLHRYTGQDDICIGSPVAGRQRQELEGLIGFFINALVLRTDLGNDPVFIDLLRRVKQKTLQAYEHQDVPFEKIVTVLDIPRDASRNPVFQVRFALQNAPESGTLQLNGLQLETDDAGQELAQIDINLVITEEPDGLYISLYYCSDLYKRETMDRMLQHYENLLQSVSKNPHTVISRLNILSSAEEKQLLHDFNQTTKEYPADKTLAELFMQQAANTPGAAAIVINEKTISYRELNERSNQLANYLIKKGIQSEHLVPVCMERGWQMIMAILAIWKAGGAYIPIDPKYPAERISYIVKDTDAKLVLVNCRDEFQAGIGNAILVALQDDDEIISNESSVDISMQSTPANLAYIIYTSGSTGLPKGAMIEQAGMLNHLYAKINELKINAGSRIAQTASCTFDISVWQMFAALVCGGTTIVYDDEVIAHPENILSRFEEDTITIAELVPSYLTSVLEENDNAKLSNLQYLLVTGEAVNPAVLQKWFSSYPGKTVVNAYGPTEASDDICHYHMHEAPQTVSVPVGKPVQNMRIYIVDKAGNHCPVGVSGEIQVAGIGVGRGYWKDEVKTNKSFINNGNERLYRTGDLGRWLPDGNIEYLGRIDEQVKIRGYRIELGEIEAVLQEAPHIMQCVVIAKEDKPGIRRLVAYVVAEDAFAKEEVIAYLKSRLPEYMVPCVFMQLENIPLTANGKIDRKKLPDVEASTATVNYQPARNTIEKTLVNIWQSLLEVQRIGVYDNFFELGGHSLLIMRMVSAIRKQLGKEVTIRTVFDHPVIAALAEIIAGDEQAGLTPVITRYERNGKLPLSFAQERLWFVDRLHGSVQYHIPWALRLKGELNVNALESSLRTIVNRHEVLRTVISEEGGIGYQDIKQLDAWQLQYIQQEEILANGDSIESYIEEYVLHPYDLAKGPMFRLTLIRLSEQEHMLVAVMHHIAFDAWSVGILVQELVELYRSKTENREPVLKELPVQYADYSIWQRNYLSGEVLENKLQYWKNQLQDVRPLELITDYPRPATQSIEGGIVYKTISSELRNELISLTKREGVTMFMGLLSVYKILLHRYTSQEDVCVGIPIAGRQHEELEGLIGFFINALALRTDLSGNPSFREVLQRVKQTTVGAYEHQEVPFEKIVEALEVERDMSRNPVFQVKFALQNAPEAGVLELGGVELSVGGYDKVKAQIDISLDVFESQEGLGLNLTYCSELYRSDTMQRLLDHYENLLKEVIKDIDRPVAELPLLSLNEEKQLLEEFNDTAQAYPKDKTIADLFEEQVRNYGNETALVFEDEKLNYQELDHRSNQLAHYLISKGVKTETLVPVCIDRSPDMIIALFAILKAGGAYVPIDSSLPADRIGYMLKDTGADIIITTSAYQELLSAESSAELVCVDLLSELLLHLPIEKPNFNITPGNLAYVIYTSGSTGLPKGVMVEHAGVINLVHNQAGPLNLRPGIRVFQFASFSFDASCYEIFLTILHGGQLVMSPKETLLDIKALSALLNEHEVELITLPTSYQTVISEEITAVKTVVSAGEALNPKLAREIQQKGIKLINAYGPTENTVCAALSESPLHESGCVTIGKPLGNVQAYILDGKMQPVPVGVMGELYLGGAQIARGYLNREELTTERFVGASGEWRVGSGKRVLLYKTGDLARWLPDGNIEYLGRTDDQVKIRGYRIELGEIETVLQQAPGVKQGVVIAKEDRQSTKKLVAYVMPGENMNRNEVLSFLQQKLPDYMVPSIMVEVNEFPLTSSGKIDRKRLPEPDAATTAVDKYIAPRNSTEQKLSDIWKDLLEVEQVSVDTNFFEAGGHSLLAIQMIAAIREVLGKEVPIKDIFDNPTIELLAACMSVEEHEVLTPTLTRNDRPASIPLSFAQERLWFIDRLQGTLQYHMPWAFRLTGDLNVQVLETSFRAITERHEVLRTVIREESGLGYQVILPSEQWNLEYIKQDEIVSKSQSLQQFIEAYIQQPFNLAEGPMLRVAVIALSPSEHIMVVVLHHIAFDGWSIPVMVDELVELYRSQVEQRTAQLKQLPVQYADYAIWQRSYLSGDVLDKKLSYWKNHLQDVEILALPSDFVRPAEQSIRGGMVHRRMSKELRNGIVSLAQQEGVTVFMSLLTVFKVLLHRYTGQQDICVGSPIAGRQQKELEGLMGFFVNTLALRTQVSNDMSVKELLQQVKQTTVGAYENQEVPFEKIVEALDIQRDLSRNPVFQVKFALQNAPNAGVLDLSGVQLAMETFDHVAAQIDISLDIAENEEGLFVGLTYCSDLYKEETIQRMIRHYENLLHSVVDGIDTAIGELKMLDADEEKQLITGFNNTGKNYPIDKTIPELFEEQVELYPNEIALVFQEEQLTFRELDNLSNQFAYYLQSKGVKEESLVPVCLDRSVEVIVAIMGILKAGAAYVPVDPAYPAERISYMLEDIGADIIVTSSDYRDLIQDYRPAAEFVCMDALNDLLPLLPSERPDRSITADTLAYVIYTSGSTGLPKGVMIEHRGVINLTYNQVAPLNLRPGIRVFQFASFSFDASCHEIFTTILHGGRLVLAPKETLLDTKLLAELLKKHEIELVTLPPSYQSAIGDEIGGLKTVISAGEALNTKLAIEIQQKGIKLINAYGPTENTVSSILSTDPLHESGCVTIGKPLDNVKAYILDSRMQPVPVGVTGALYLGGVQLARGYWNREELTQERFVEASGKSVRMYKTGDLARWLPDGNIEYMGRADDQVKIRGYRVELGEIETVLQQAPGVKLAVVIAKEDKQGTKKLIAYVVHEGTTKEEVTVYLKSKLPDYMVPSVMIEMESLPLNNSGKVDRKKLPDADSITTGTDKYKAATNVTEAKLVAIWQELLEVERIGIEDDFFESGGHSLLAIQLISAIRKEFGKEIAIKEVFEYPTIAQLSQQVNGQQASNTLPAITKHDRTERIPLSFAQERLWFIDRLQGSVQYHMPWVFRLTGELDIDALQQSFKTIVNRHEILRTVIREEDGIGYQYITDANQWQLQYIAQENISDASLQSHIEKYIHLPYDLSSDQLLRVKLIRISANEHILIAVIHHIAFDGLSVSTMVNELAALYRSYHEGRDAILQPLPVQYADYAIWQRNYLSGETLQQKLSYWKNKLDGVEPLELLTDYKRPALPGIKGASASRIISKSIRDGIVSLSQQEGVTVFMATLAAFKVLLHRYTAQEDICVGTPVGGRQQQEIEGLIGLFVNTLALRTQVNSQLSFRQLLQEVRQTTLDAYGHQELPFEKVVEALGIERDMSRTPIFQVMFSLINAGESNALDLGDVELTKEIHEKQTADFDISFDVAESPAGMQLVANYCTDLYSPATIDRMLMHYENLLEAVISNADAAIGSIQILSDEEQLQLEQYSQNHEKPDLPYETILELLEQQVQQSPHAVALVFGQEQLTYSELNEHSNKLAHYLRNQGVKEEIIVPLCINRSFEMIIAMLGILKAGGAYLPIDPAYPVERISYMLDNCKAAIILTTLQHKDLFSFAENEKIILCLDEIGNELETQPSEKPGNELAGHHLAYIIYTSGSTGKPKGVMTEHAALLNFVTSMTDVLNIGTNERMLQFYNYCFDASIAEIFPALVNSATLVLIPEKMRLDKNSFERLLVEEKITHLDVTPGFLNTLQPGKYAGLRRVISGGEQCTASLAAQWGEHVVFYNAYGPTEAAVTATIYRYSKHDIIHGDGLPIGKPLSNTSVYILDKQMNPVPVGIAGELYISGVQVARGYLNRDELTKERFVNASGEWQVGNGPSTPLRTLRMYKTGDLARWLPDGNIEYLGRVDEQVKIRGYRVELGEIENVLQQLPGVKQSVVLLKQEQHTKRLIAYVVSENGIDKHEVNEYLSTQLPDYMVPSVLVEIPEIPLTSNDKIDKKRLLGIDITGSLTDNYQAPRNETEMQLAAVWQDLLGAKRIGIEDNFFELGGDSIITIQVVSRMKRLGYLLSPRDLFLHQTIAKLSAAISEREMNNAKSHGEQGLLTGASGLLPIQEVFFETEQTTVSHYNQAVLLGIDKQVDVELLDKCVKKIVAQHDSLRFRYELTQTGWKQFYGTYKGMIDVEDLREVSEVDLPETIRQHGEKYQRSLNIEQGILIRVVLMHTPEREAYNRLLVVIHHLAIDGVSWRILLEDLEQLLTDVNTQLPVKTNSYREWYNELVTYSESKRLLSQHNYWQKTVQAYRPIKTDKQHEGISVMSDMGIHAATLSAERTLELLQQVPQAYHTEINDILLACLARTIAEWNDPDSYRDKVVIGLEGHGREDIFEGMDTSRTTGWFTTLYPVLLELPEGRSNDSLLKSVKEQLRKMPDKGIGYGVVKYMHPSTPLRTGPLTPFGTDPWDIVFNYLGQADNVVNKSKWFTGAEESTGRTLHEKAVLSNKLEINSIISGGELVIKWSYDTNYYQEETVSKLAAQYISNLEEVIAHCIEQCKNGSVYTPSDYGLTEVSYEELDDFLDEKINGRTRKGLIESVYRLSGLQEGILFHGLYDKHAGAYMQQVKCEIVDLDVDAFRKSWNILLQKHTILRSSFHHNDLPVPVQCVYKSVNMPVEVLDLRMFSQDEQLQKIKDYQAADLRKGFDFRHAPLMRATLMQLSDNRYKMLWTTHHLPLDGWSVPMLVQEFLHTYDACVANTNITVEVDRYEDYIRYIERTDKDKEEQYWRNYLHGLEGGTLLPYVSTAADRTLGVSEYREEPWLLGEELTGRIEAYAQQHHITVNTVMQAVWCYLLHRSTGNANVAFGITVSGRPENLPGVEQRVGMFINAIPLHSKMDEDKNVIEWLQSLQAEQSLSLEYQYTPLGKIQSWVDAPGELFDSMITFQNFPVSKIVSSHEWKLKVENLEVYEPTSNYPFSIRILLGREMYIQFIYREEVLRAEYVKQMRNHFENVLLQLIEKPEAKLCDINVLSPVEHQVVTEEFNNTDKNYPIDKTIPELFEEQVELYPNEIALVFQEEQLTFRELDNLSNQFAYYLQSKGVKEETLVPVCLDRSVEVIVAIMGILKAGAAYVPVDPAYPAERISYMLEDIGADIIVTSSDYRDLIQDYRPAAEFVCMDALNDLLPLLPSERPDRSITADTLAYVIYTSGSTGLPKGVMIEHRGVINLTYNQVAPLNLRPGIRVFQFASFSFDASCHEIFTTILHGGRLVLAPKETLLDTKLLAELLKKHEIELVTLPPSYQSAIGDEIGGLKTVISAGEALNTKLAIEIQQKGIKLINAYGPTENTVSSILSTDPLHESGCVTIGKPLDNVKAYILDSRMQPVPVGVTGALYLGGVQLARGYWNRDELTRERFVEASGEWEVASGKSIRMYKTGDLARWLPDGNIEYMGRADDQVKIRGYRVELGEIETVLQQAPGVKLGVVIAKEDKQGTKKLIAYIVHEGTTKEEVTVYLKSKLPDYMVPSVMIEMESLPLNNSGKVDRKKLPDADSITTGTDKYKAATNETEAKLVAIWQELLEVERIGIEDDFFESGGHSLLAIQLISAIRKEFGKEIAIKDVFDYPTIAQLAEQVINQNIDAEALPAISRYERTVKLPLSFSQERLWFIDRLQGSVQYHMPWAFRLKGELNVDAFQQSFRTIVNRHEILRTVIKEEDGIGYQYITDADQWQLQYVQEPDILASGITRQEFIEEFLSRPYDLSKDPMLRVTLIKLSEEEHMLVALLHHIAFDGWSISILVEELVEIYRSTREGRTPVLKPLPVQYVDYSIWQRTYLSGQTLESKLEWWKKQLHDVEPLALLTDHVRPPGQTINGGVIHKRMSKQLRDDLAQLCQQEGTTMFMTLLSVFKMLLHRYTGQSDICVGSPVAGRHRQEIEGLIGLFVNTLALRSDINGKMTYHELLKQIRQTTLDAYEHQDVPFEKVVEALGVERDLSRSPIFQAMFVLQNLPKNTALDLGNLSLSGEEAGSITSKFDLNLSVSESADGLYVSLTYCSDLFRQDTIERMLVHYENLLHAVLANKNTALEKLPMLTEAEMIQIKNFSSSTVEYPLHKTVVDLFEEQVLNTPDALAVVFEDEELTYHELNERADQLAAWLMHKGVEKDEFVVISVKRSLECVIGILGILKAGAAFVPIDPGYPDERIAYILSDTSSKICLADASIKQRALSISDAVQFVNIKEEWDLIISAPAARPQPPAPNNLAYVIYTSGSTGKPKGVLIAHQALVDHVFGVIESAELQDCVSFALFASLVADAGHSMLFSAFVMGSAVHVLSDETLADGEKLVSYLRDNSIDAIKLVPSLWMAYADDDHIPLPRKMLMFGGESFQMNILDLLLHAGYKGNVFNHYGPTEATIGKTIHKINLERKYNSMPIGAPFSNTNAYIFNPAFEFCPVGVPGELYLGGDGLANGYLNLPELTNEKFILLDNGERLYRTGDIVRWSPEGDIEYLGRTDDQVKIRGHRIELGEIASVLQLAPGVKQGLVFTKTDKHGINRLVGYVVADEGYDKETVMAYLRSKVPDYMIPAVLMELDSIPLTTIGKIDRKKLPEPDFTASSSVSFESPRNEVEMQLAAIWHDLLGAERIGIHDNFFELGGDSIITIQVVSRVKRLQYELYPRDLFLHQTIAKLAALVTERLGSASRRVGEQGILTGSSGLLPIQQAYLQTEPAHISHYNQSVLLSIDKNITEEILSQAVKALLMHHDSLRFTYTNTPNGWEQVYGSYEGKLDVEDVSAVVANELPFTIEERSEHYQRSLDITSGLLVRTVLFITNDSDTYNRLLVVIHHLAIDGVSWRILLEDLELLLNSFSNNEQPDLGQKTSSYREWYNGLVKYGETKKLLSQKNYWQKVVQSYQPLKTDKQYDGHCLMSEISNHAVKLNAERTRKLLQEVPQAYHTEINDILLACLSKTLVEYNKANNLVIGMEGHGREDILDGLDVSRTVGWFTNIYPVLLEVQPGTEEGSLLKSVKEQLRRIPDKGLGYGILKYMHPSTTLGTSHWDVVFNYLGQSDNVVSKSKWLAGAGEPSGNPLSEAVVRHHKLEVNSVIGGGELNINWNYSSKHFDAATIQALAEKYMNNLESIIDHCLETIKSGSVYTPSDYGLTTEISYEELDKFLDAEESSEMDSIMNF